MAKIKEACKILGEAYTHSKNKYIDRIRNKDTREYYIFDMNDDMRKQ